MSFLEVNLAQEDHQGWLGVKKSGKNGPVLASKEINSTSDELDSFNLKLLVLLIGLSLRDTNLR